MFLSLKYRKYENRFFFLKPKFFKEQYFWLRIRENVLTQFQ